MKLHDIFGELKRTTLISFFIHLLGIFIFYIRVESPIQFPLSSSSHIAFLGSLLDEKVFQMIPLERIETKREKKDWVSWELLKPITTFPDNIQPSEILKDMSELELGTKVKLENRSGPFYVIKTNSFVLASVQSMTIKMEGEVQKRTILYHPDLPKYPSSIIQFPRECDVVIHFRVSPKGLIQQIERVISSGESDLDILAIRYLRQWRFAPLQTDINNNSRSLTMQRGILKIHYSPHGQS